MSSRWAEALGSINAWYVEDLAKGGSFSAKVTLATFDGQDGLHSVAGSGLTAPDLGKGVSLGKRPKVFA